MIYVIHFWLYVFFVIGVLLYLASRWAVAGRFTAGCRAALCGLLASLFGLALPYGLFFTLGRLCYGHGPPYGGSEDSGAPLLALLLLFGPMVCPPAIFTLAVLLYYRRRA